MAVFKFIRAPREREGAKRSCEDHGDFVEVLVEHFDAGFQSMGCPRCYWEALNTADPQSERHLNALRARSELRLNDDLFGSGIGPRFVSASFENYTIANGDAQAKALSKCQAYAEQFAEHRRDARCLLLLGQVGTGKTHLACSIAQAVIRNRLGTALVVTAAEVVRAAKSTMVRNGGYTEDDLLDELGSVDLLVLDEVGGSLGTEYERSVLHEVLERRYRLIKPSVVCSNMTAKDLGQYIGERALDRLRENDGQVVGFTWASARRGVPTDA